MSINPRLNQVKASIVEIYRASLDKIQPQIRQGIFDYLNPCYVHL